MEKNCKWYFGNEGGIDIGPNDPIHQTFKGNPYYSIVREAIQNSLDVVNDDRYPVEMNFQNFEMDRSQYPNLFRIEEHIKQALDYYKNNSDAKRLFGDMLKYLEESVFGMRWAQIACLRIADSNTQGMHYIRGNTESPFYAFLRAAGVSSKLMSGSGGSFGFGKGAYFALSPLKTLIVSSMDQKGNVYFEGATRLTTHINERGDKLTAYGFYDSKNGEPNTDNNEIPEIFQRTETGTDINIIGLWPELDRHKLMVTSVLNNFWLSILENKLVVTIDDLTISRDNLEQVIGEYFLTEYEKGNASDIELWNPKPYFKAVRYANANDQFKLFSGELNTIGRVNLYVYLEKGLPNRTSYFRSPKMVVYKQTRNIIKGYVAVFVCDNKNGNEILRSMENPSHNVWDSSNAPQEEGKVNRIAKRAEKEINDFVVDVLSKLSKVSSSNKVAFLGLEDYLSIPEDLMEREDNSDLSGENSNTSGGTEGMELIRDETGMQTTEKSEPISIKPTIKPKVEIREEQHVYSNDFGDLDITAGDETDKPNPNPNPGPGPGPGGIGSKGLLSDNPTNGKVLRRVKLRVVAQKERDAYWHNLLINSEEYIEKAELELLVSGDNDRDDGIVIISTDFGQIEGNILRSLSLAAGKNQIKIRFADNLKHSIKVRAYEVQ